MKLSKTLALTVAVSLAFYGCSTRSKTKPRSDVLSEAASAGVTMPSLEEDRAAFFAQEAANEKRIVALIKKRADSTYRDASYRIGAGDSIEVAVFDVPELNVTAPVRQTGVISLPLVGAVPAVGKTESELQEALAARLKTYVKNPQVSIAVAEYGSQKVAVMGAVDKPGTYPLKKGSNSILELLGEAGGTKEKAGNYITFIPAELSGISAESDIESRAKLALASQKTTELKDSGIDIYLAHILGTQGGIPLEVPVRGGDMIVVPEGGTVSVEGEVTKVGNFELGRNSSVIGALAAAGGITYGAKVDEVEVIRDIDGRQVHLVLNLEKIARGEEQDVKLRTGDTVRVPSDAGRRLSQDVYESITNIMSVGVGFSPLN